MWPLNLLRAFNNRTERRAAPRLYRAGRSRRVRVVLGLELLEDRSLPSGITFTVDLPGDAGVGSGTSGDIRYCINKADQSANSNIVFNTQAIGSNTLTLSNGSLPITNNVEIFGPGANLLTIFGGTALDRIFFVSSSARGAYITGLTISGGVAGSDISGTGGGGVYNSGILTLTGVEVTENKVVVSGSGNAEGGGIYNAGGGVLYLEESTVENNYADAIAGSAGVEGGGIYNAAGALLTMYNDTVADNELVIKGIGTALGGGIYNAAATGSRPDATLQMANDTIADNTMSSEPVETGGGIYNGGFLALLNSIVYNPQQGVGVVSDVGGSINADGGNLFGTQIPGASSSDLVNANPMLGPLQNNGGPTPTMGLAANSPAFGRSIPGIHLPDGSFLAAPDTDQRGIARPVSGMDIGAYQHQVEPPKPPPPPPKPPVGPPAPVGSLSLFALGFGPGSQLDLFEVDQSGQVFAVPMLNLFGGHTSPVFVNTGLVMGFVIPSANGVIGTLVSNDGQSYLAEIINLSNPAVLTAVENALSNETASLSHGVWPPPSPQIEPGFSGSLRDPVSMELSLGDEFGDARVLSGNGTVTIIGDGNAQHGVNISATVTLSQDSPLQPQGSHFSWDYSGTYTLTGHANYEGNGYYGGGTLYFQSATGLLLETQPGWSIYVNQSANPPYFEFGADLQQYSVAPGGFGITALGVLDAGPGS